jgi:hypothetical protein
METFPMSTAPKLNIQELAMRQIRVDHGLQARVETKAENVLDYFNAMEAYKASGIRFGFPPIVVYFDGKTYWLADGFHRFKAWEKAGGISISAEIREGTKQEAILFSVSANLKMGFRPNIEDRKKAVQMLLEHKEYRDLTDTEIGRRCGTQIATVRAIREKWCSDHGVYDDGRRIKATKWGTTSITYHTVDQGIKREVLTRDSVRTDKRGRMSISWQGKKRHLGKRDAPNAEERIETAITELQSQSIVKKIGISSPAHLSLWFLRRGVILSNRPKGTNNIRPNGGAPGLSPDLCAPGFIIRVEPKLTPRSLPAALGDVLLWRQANDPKAVAVVVCYPDDDVKDMIRHAKALGVEFLTPHEVVERFAAK